MDYLFSKYDYTPPPSKKAVTTSYDKIEIKQPSNIMSPRELLTDFELYLHEEYGETLTSGVIEEYVRFKFGK